MCASSGKVARGLNSDRGLATERRGQIQELFGRLNRWGWSTNGFGGYRRVRGQG